MAEVEFRLEGRLNVLHVIVEHRHCHDGRQGGHRRDGNANKSEPAEGLRFIQSFLFVVMVHRV
jgi:hypothetical protein